MVLGGLAHTIIGEKNVISKLKAQKDAGQFPDDEAFNLIRWFWYLGSYISFWVGAVAIIIGATDMWLDSEALIGQLLATIMLGFSVITFGVVAMLNPRSLLKLAQVTILWLVTVLLWLGAM